MIFLPFSEKQGGREGGGEEERGRKGGRGGRKTVESEVILHKLKKEKNKEEEEEDSHFCSFHSTDTPALSLAHTLNKKVVFFSRGVGGVNGERRS